MKKPDQFISSNVDFFLDCIDDIVTILDKDGKIEKVNKAFEVITGIDAKPYVGQNIGDLVKRDLMKSSAALTAIRTKQPVTMNVEYYTGQTLTWTYAPVFNMKGELERVIGTGRDITNWVKLESQLRQHEIRIDQYHQEIKEWKEYFGSSKIIHASDEMLRIIEKAIKISKTDSAILILGETGVGKELIAELIHRSSPRKEKPFIVINSAAIPAELMESELFGYEEGAFTGAKKSGKQGLLEKARGGTVFLDEIGELPLNMQSKLLRVTQEARFTRIGGHRPQEVDFRIIAATNIGREQMMDDRKFRQDLFYRLGAVIIQVPPLRERRGDIFPLTRHFSKQFNLKYGKNVRIPSHLMPRLYEYDWPGNVRELKNVINSLIVLGEGDEVQEEELSTALRLNKRIPQLRDGGKSGHDEPLPELAFPEPAPSRKPAHQMEEALFRKVYREHGSMTKAAAALGIHPSTLYRKIRKGLIRPE